MSGKYFELLRNNMSKSGSILYMKDLSEIQTFMKTKQDTMLFIFQKNSPKIDKYKVKMGSKIFYSFHKKKLENFYKNTTTIKEMGGSVKTGSCVWNQNKEKLTDDAQNSIPLIYPANIVANNIVFKELGGEKKQYVTQLTTWLNKPSIVINRGFGKSNNYKLLFAKCDFPQYVCENHTNVISIDDSEKLEMIYESFKNPKTVAWCNLFLGNGQLSKTEIEEYMPIYL